MNGAQEAESEPRRLGVLLLIGMLSVPAICVWFTLRRGYAASFRQAAFVYTGTLTVMGVLGAFAR